MIQISTFCTIFGYSCTAMYIYSLRLLSMYSVHMKKHECTQYTVQLQRFREFFQFSIKSLRNCIAGYNFPSSIYIKGYNYPSSIYIEGYNYPSKIYIEGYTYPSKISIEGYNYPSKIYIEGYNYPSKIYTEGSNIDYFLELDCPKESRKCLMF